MKKIERRAVDDHLPKWLHSRFLSAVHYIWEVKGDNEESIRRVHDVDNSGQFTAEEMSWIMMLLTIPKLQTIIESSDDWKKFQEMKKERVH
tara:strand:+ start:182 stop:454 length:273 start_codon:yes stop_codon:yes gene_type:complete